MTTRPTLSLCMIALNNERSIARTLDSVAALVDEIIVVDGGSTDPTPALVRRYPQARVIESPWQGHYGRQRNIGLDAATSDWVLCLDSDEAMGANFRQCCAGLLAQSDFDLFAFPRYSLCSEAPLCYVSAPALYPDFHPRLWRNGLGIRYIESRPVHEYITHLPDASRGFRLVDTHIFHFDFILNSTAQRRAKVERYNTYGTQYGSGVAQHYLYEDYPHTIEPCLESL